MYCSNLVPKPSHPKPVRSPQAGWQSPLITAVPSPAGPALPRASPCPSQVQCLLIMGVGLRNHTLNTRAAEWSGSWDPPVWMLPEAAPVRSMGEVSRYQGNLTDGWQVKNE